MEDTSFILHSTGEAHTLVPRASFERGGGHCVITDLQRAAQATPWPPLPYAEQDVESQGLRKADPYSQARQEAEMSTAHLTFPTSKIQSTTNGKPKII